MSIAFLGPCPPSGGAGSFSISTTFRNWTPNQNYTIDTPLLAPGLWTLHYTVVNPTGWVATAFVEDSWVIHNLRLSAATTSSPDTRIITGPGALLQVVKRPFPNQLKGDVHPNHLVFEDSAIGIDPENADACNCLLEFAVPVAVRYIFQSIHDDFDESDWTSFGVPENLELLFYGEHQ